MNVAQLLADLKDVPESLFDDAIWDSLMAYFSARGINLYPAQEEASMNLLAGDHVILATPTGSGKTMVAIAAQFIALARGQRSFYTAPIKALVNEKFFSLCEIFGAENVGLMTGDATVNGKAPIICATAEIVANIALRDGKTAPIDQVIMDEFHYYSEPQRGWAWQVPLLLLPHTQFLLMSATLGDTSWLEKDLTSRTGRKTSVVAGTVRPVPLTFDYVYTPVHETIDDLVKKDLAPIYVVHFSQREAIERAQSLTSTDYCSREEKAALAAEIGDFRFSSIFGKTLSKLLRRGIGIHHAGMLPKYRRLVERLAQQGMLKVICGTDTLGVGINVPIRTVLLTGLAKYDGEKERILKSREFHQIAGRAGRAGFDTVGTVVIQAPDHEIENYRLRQKAGSDEKKLKKLRKKAAPQGRVSWSLSTFERLTTAEPEQLTSQFKVSTSLLLNVLAQPGNTYENMKYLLRTNHDQRKKQTMDAVYAIELLRGLIAAGIVQRRKQPDSNGNLYELAQEVPRDFALNQPLAPFALAALELLDPEAPTFTLDVLSVVESVLEPVRVILQAQERAARAAEYNALKAEGVDYNERQALLDEVTYPQPLREILEPAFETYAEGHPWVKDFELTPKSIVRDMVEHGMTFSDFTSTYGLARAEGGVLRYLTDCWKALLHSVPEQYVTEELDDIIVWLGELIMQVDSSLVDEWAQMIDPDQPVDEATVKQELAFGVADPSALSANRRAFKIMIRNAMFRLVELFADEKEEALAEMFEYLRAEEVPDWPEALDDYFDEFDEVIIDQDARGGSYFTLDENLWLAQQVIKDPDDARAYRFVAYIDVPASDAAGEVRFSKVELQQN